MARPRSIIAMKGPPFTRKTEFATLIAKSLKCPVLSLEDVLDILHPDSFPSSPSSTCSAHDVAFQILCQMAKSHLQKEVSDNVVIDSPLSTQSHLDNLITLAKSLSVLSSQSRLVIVECSPKSVYSWRLKFDSYIEHHSPMSTRKWYKAKSWEDVEVAIKKNKYDERARGYEVSKIILDPLLDIPSFVGVGPSEHPAFVEAIRYMTTRKKGYGPHIVIYHQWRQSHYLSIRKGKGGHKASIMTDAREQKLCQGAHCINGYSDEGIEHEAYCLACTEQVTGATYTCKDCSLALHKLCAESYNHKITTVSPFELEMNACTSCKADGKSTYCASCVFEMNLKHRIMPTVIRHKCEKHFLSLVISPKKLEVHLCAACGNSDMQDSYSCGMCNRAYHFKCLTEAPLRVAHVHGGHHHHMLLKFSTELQAEDYVCDECLEWRDPRLWSYTCVDCPYEAHMYCILQRTEDKLLPSLANSNVMLRMRVDRPEYTSARYRMPPIVRMDPPQIRSAGVVGRAPPKLEMAEPCIQSMRAVPIEPPETIMAQPRIQPTTPVFTKNPNQDAMW